MYCPNHSKSPRAILWLGAFRILLQFRVSFDLYNIDYIPYLELYKFPVDLFFNPFANRFTYVQIIFIT